MDRKKPRILRDCTRAMYPSIITSIFKDTLLAQITIIIAGVLGQFADAIFNSNVSWGIENLFKIIACLTATIFLIPLIGLIGEKLMFSNSLKHDRIILNRFLDKKYDSILSFDAGSAQYRLENDPNELRKQWLDITNKCIVTPIVFVVLIIITFNISVIFTAITMSISLLKLIIPIFVKNIMVKFDKMNREYETQVRAYQTEFSTKPHAVSMLGLQRGFLNNMDLLFNKYYTEVFIKSNNIAALTGFISAIIKITSILIIFISGSIMVANHSISAGSILSMMTYLSVFDVVLGNTSSIIRGIPLIKNIYVRVSELYANGERMTGLSINNINNIEVDNLTYCYGDEEVISNISFRINKGDKIAVCGKNGSGKTTLINILSSLLIDYSGRVCIDGVALEDISIYSFRKKMTLALQEPFLFSGSIRENIAIGGEKSKVSVESIINEFGIANIADRVITTKENDLSGGEKQKVSIARCLMRDCDVIILDEPTNNLDKDSKEWLYNFIKQTSKTIIYISHDDRFSKIADKIITL